VTPRQHSLYTGQKVVVVRDRLTFSKVQAEADQSRLLADPFNFGRDLPHRTADRGVVQVPDVQVALGTVRNVPHGKSKEERGKRVALLDAAGGRDGEVPKPQSRGGPVGAADEAFELGQMGAHRL